MRHLRYAGLLLLCMSLAGCLFDDNSNNTVPTSGLRTVSSAGLQRSYYLDLPSDYDPAAAPGPLIIAYHGTGGSHQAWFDYYRLREVVGDGAILVYPDALPNSANINQWDFENDFQMFEDLLDRLPALVNFDASRIFITGHSSGGGFAHEVGCKYGDRIRAIAPVAGSLTATTCVGAVAVLQIQGEYDPLVPIGVAELGHRFWTLYNGFSLGYPQSWHRCRVHRSCARPIGLSDAMVSASGRSRRGQCGTWLAQLRQYRDLGFLSWIVRSGAAGRAAARWRQ